MELKYHIFDFEAKVPVILSGKSTPVVRNGLTWCESSVKLKKN